MQDELAGEAIRAMCRKYGGSAKVWLRALDHALRRGEGEAARRTLERALAALPPRKRIKVRIPASQMGCQEGNCCAQAGVAGGACSATQGGALAACEGPCFWGSGQVVAEGRLI